MLMLMFSLKMILLYELELIKSNEVFGVELRLFTEVVLTFTKPNKLFDFTF
jgi:hypothetical protein